MAAAAHERDLAEERARLAGDGVAQLERRIERLRRDGEKELAEGDRERQAAQEAAERSREEIGRLQAEHGEARQSLEARERELEDARQAAQGAEQELAAALSRLEAREGHLANAKAGIESRDRRLEVADERLQAREKELKALGASLEAERVELADVRARLELREEELGRSATEAGQAKRELTELRAKLEESERELAVRERDLAARIRELGQAGEELLAREREVEQAADRLVESERALEAAGERLTARERDLEAAGTLLETQGAQLARTREALTQAQAQLAQTGEEARDAAHERDEANARLEARERHLDNAKQGIAARNRRLEVADRRQETAERALRSRDAELERLRVAARDRDRKLALAEARLEKAQQRAEHFQGSLVELRQGRSYRLMRILWRLRRPFRRTPRKAEVEAEGSEDADPTPPVPREQAEPSAAARPSLAREAPPRRPDAPLRVASILDEMSAACFAPECDLVPLTLEGWAEQLDERAPDLLLVESAWNGNGGEWQYRIAQYPRKDLVGLPALRALLDGCRERGIPTAFWNKEDPVHFDRFAEAAALFDHVFTTDARCVERYRALPGERTVTPLPFAAQPRVHNPAAVVPERSSSPCFAGAWYRDRHADRRQALEGVLDAARPYGLVIYDRRFGADDDAFGFPERFAPHVLGKLPYERILDVYKSHRVFLNANSVVDSPTMCSRRVFELAACDTAILSTPGAALAALLGEGVVEEAADEETAAAALERLLGDEDERRRRTRTARRAVFAEHTYADRLATIAAVAGLDGSYLRREPFAPPRAAANGADDSLPWRLPLQTGVSLAESALTDLAAATTFAEADAIGIGIANGGPTPEHRRVSALDPRALLLRRDLLESRGAPTGSAEEVTAQLRRWSDEGVRLYAADADLLAA